MGGGTKVLLSGAAFKPWDWKDDINNQNDTFCDWGALGKTPCQVLSENQAECESPPNAMHLEWAPVNLTLNNQNYTDDDIRFLYYNPPKILSASPLRGPVKGGTVVNLWGTQFEKNRNITCQFGKTAVQAKYISKTRISCAAPQTELPGAQKLLVKY
jgi:hypothetical protein